MNEKIKMENELYHHGIKGQKWGVRRYQNSDGSLTPAGKKRYSSSDISKMSNDELRKKIRRMSNEQRYIELTKPSNSKLSKAADGIDQGAKLAGSVNKVSKAINGKSPSVKIAGQAIEGVSKSAGLAKRIDDKSRDKKHANKVLPMINNMNDDDLARRVERLDLERQYKSLDNSITNRGKIKASEILSIAGDILAIGASATVIAINIKKLKG